MFFSGASLFVLRDRVPLSKRYCLALFCLMLMAAIQKDVFVVVYSAGIAYFVLSLAYLPSGRVRRFNELGDYSYGLYVFSFPVQQSIVALRPSVSVSEMVILASSFSLVLACMSWHFIERRALQLKSGKRWLPKNLHSRL
jgi:peptidoglycan/LPS O-acetylase OafA/YrhL